MSDNKIEDIIMPITPSESDSGKNTNAPAGNKKQRIRRIIGTISAIAFFIFTALFINEVLIQPYRTSLAIKRSQDLYQGGNQPTSGQTAKPSPSISPDVTTGEAITVEPHDPDRDSEGRLLVFKDLLELNPDIKGWITIPNTNINYPVLQSSREDPEFYLRRNIDGKYDKAGCLFLDIRSSVERNTQSLVIYGHNMYSTGTMFHQIPNYTKLKFYKENPIIQFDTIYNTGYWKVFAVFITNGSSDREKLFDYTQANFPSSSEFLNFVYQLRVRSILDIDVDVSENDKLLLLSTCSYEIDNYRTIVVARRVRDGESLDVNVDTAKKNDNPLYTELWYKYFGGTPPNVTNFEKALITGEIDWYTNANEVKDSNMQVD